MRIPVTLLIALASFTGCGFKGPLYVPVRATDTAKPAAPAPAVAAPQNEERPPVPTESVPTPK